MRKTISLLSILLTISGISYADTHIPAGNVSGTWTYANSPYIIDGEINIPVDSTLTIEPGIQVLFSGHYKFNIYGRLLAEGTETDTITFTAQNTTTGWHGLRFFDTNTNGQDSSKVIYSKLEYGKANGTGQDACGGAIYCKNSSIIIQNNYLGNNEAEVDFSGYGGAIYCSNSSSIIKNNSIRNNTAGNEEGFGGGICCVDTSYVTIENNIIEYNNAGIEFFGYGGGIYSSTSNLFIINNTIENNTAGFEEGGMGIGGGIYCSNYTDIQLNEIRFNSAKGSPGKGAGIYCDGTTNIISNTIESNNINGYDPMMYSMEAYGGGIWCDGDVLIEDNNIQNNIISMYHDVWGGGIYFSDYSGTCTIRNNTITGNQVYGEAIMDIFSSAHGGGIYCEGSTDIQNNQIINNSASAMSDGMDDVSANAYGGGIYLSNVTNFSYNLISGNTASAHAMGIMNSTAIAHGGGVYCGTVDMINNTITENSVSASANVMEDCSMFIEQWECEMSPECYWDPVLEICLSLNPPIEDALGGGVYCNSSSTILNSILWSNSPDEIYSSPTATYSDIQGGWSGTGNIDADPLFVDPLNNDFHLTLNSPCIDAGNPDSQYNDPDGTRNDMGAYYFDQSIPLLTAKFTVSDSVITILDTIQFTDLSTPQDSIIAWEWYFGDGDSSSVQNPAHIYTTVDTFDVTLIVYSNTQSDTTVKEDYIVVTSPISAPQNIYSYGETDGSHLYWQSVVSAEKYYIYRKTLQKRIGGNDNIVSWGHCEERSDEAISKNNHEQMLRLLHPDKSGFAMTPPVKNKKPANVKQTSVTKTRDNFTIIDSVYADTTYIDTSITEQTIYLYKVTAVDTNGYESAFSNAVDGWKDVKKCPQFNGTDEHIEMMNTSNLILSANDNFSFSAWIKGNDNSAHIISNAVQEQDQHFYLYIYQNRVWFGGEGDGNSNDDCSGSNIPVNDNQWHNVVGVHNANTGLLSIYIDGILDTTNQISAQGTYTNNERWQVGRRYCQDTQVNDNYFAGNIDEVCVWNIALSQTEVKQLMHTKINPVTEHNVLAYYRFNEGIGLTAHDYSVNANHGTMSNMDNSNWVNGVDYDICPKNLTRQDNNHYNIKLIWEPPNDFSSFNWYFIYKGNSASSISPYPYAFANKTDSSYIDIYVTSGQKYYYKINAYDQSAQMLSIPSNIEYSWIDQTNALQFDGTDDGVNLGDYDFSNPFTISAYVKPDTIKQQAIITKYNQTNNDKSLLLRMEANGTFLFNLFDNASSPILTIQGGNYTTNQWCNAVVTYDGTNAVMYIDTTQIGTISGTGFYNNDVNTIIGRTDDTLYCFDGTIDEVRIWNSALSQSEINGLMNTEITPSMHPDLVGYWRFNEGFGTIAQDYTTKQNDGMIENFADTIWVNGYPFPEDELIADFGVTNTEGIAPFTVTFYDSSSGYPTQWEWDFDNNGTIDSYDQNPTHTYTDVAQYSVKLTVYRESASDDTIKYNYINVYAHGTNGPIGGIWYEPTYINGNIILEPDSSLIINPGVPVYFLGDYTFTVQGQLNVNGLQDSMVQFIPQGVSQWQGIQIDTCQGSVNINNTYIEGAVNGISITDCSDIITVSINNCNITYSGVGDTTAVRISNSNVNIQNSIFEGYINGFNIQEAEIKAVTIRNNRVRPNPRKVKSANNYGMYLKDCNNCQILNNKLEEFDVLIYAEDCTLSVEYDTLMSPQGNEQIGVYFKSSAGSISYNLFQNVPNPIKLEDSPDVIIVGNKIIPDESKTNEICMNIINSDVSIDKMTICKYTTGLYIDDDSDVSVKNSIFWGNTTQIDNSGSLSITYSDIQGGYSGTGNIDDDPQFVDFTNNDYNLQEISPCIDNGDPNSPLDPDNSRADMSAFPFTHPIFPDKYIVDFGNILFNTTAEDSVIIINDGGLTYTDFTFTHSDTTLADSIFFVVLSDTTLLPGGNIILNTTFAPTGGITYLETLRVVNNVNFFDIVIRGKGFGEAPLPPENVQIWNESADVHLKWSKVDSTVLGNPVIVNYYKVYIGTDIEGSYVSFATQDTSFIHIGGGTNPKAFYYITACAQDIGKKIVFVNSITNEMFLEKLDELRLGKSQLRLRPTLNQ